jgi:hypothetical protein
LAGLRWLLYCSSILAQPDYELLNAGAPYLDLKQEIVIWRC